MLRNAKKLSRQLKGSASATGYGLTIENLLQANHIDSISSMRKKKRSTKKEGRPYSLLSHGLEVEEDTTPENSDELN
jgi:hypothetical protein